MLAPVQALVTGGAGFIGSALARALLAEGWAVRVLDSLVTAPASQVPIGATFIEGDVRSAADTERAVEGCDVVFHQAALRSVAHSVEDPMLSQTCNTQGTLQVLLSAAAAGVRRVVNASTCAVYGDGGAGITEDAPLAPASPYAVSKIAGEMYGRLFSDEHRIEVVTLRYFNVFGPGQRPESRYSAVFPAFAAALTTGSAPEVHWDGEQTRDFVAVDDVVRANILAASAPDVAGQTINIGAGRPRSINEVLRAVADACGVWIDPVRTPMRAGDVRDSSADIARARAMLGWEPSAPFESVVAATVASFTSRR